ncbi:MAG: transcription termination/antitermination protein NusG [Planctomycetales bacterium]
MSDDSTNSTDDARSAGDGPPADAAGNGEGTPGDDKQWYVLKVQSNRERTIRDTLLRRIKREGLEQYFGEIIIPTEKVAETKGGKKRVVERKLFPGYMMINMVLNDETWYLVRDTSGIGDFTGTAGTPQPMLPHEVEKMLGGEEEKAEEPAKIKIDFTIGDTVKVMKGNFESFEGTIDAIDEASGRITVLIEIFGRSTPVELEYWQVEAV